MRVLNKAFDHPLKTEEEAAALLAGGIMQHGYQCGMIWGATLAAGAQAYRLYGPGPLAETAAIIAAQRLIESYRVRKKSINCLEITGIDKSSSSMQMMTYFLIKGGTIGCMRMAAKYAQEAFSDINAALSEKYIEAPSPPVSCAAMLAQKMDTSIMHAMMVSGFAGGIGLSGGACGALGAAIWIIGMEEHQKGISTKLDFKSPEAIAAIDKFTKCTDYKFECSEIVGRKFENIDDHASYLCDGGCSELIEVLAAK